MFDGRYKIVDAIGRGSFGLVLEALDLIDENNKSVICKINKSKTMNEFEGLIL